MKIKYAFFDFDDTLCLWKYINDGLSSYDKLQYEEGKYWYVNYALKNFVEQLNKEGIVCYVLTHCTDNNLTVIKKEFCDKYFKNCFRAVIAVDNYEDKVEAMFDCAESHKISNESILFVDDLYYTNELATNAGFSVVTPQMAMLKGMDIFNEEWRNF